MVADRGFSESKSAVIVEKNVGAESNLVCLQSLENLSEMSPEYPGPHIAGHPAGLAAISGGGEADRRRFSAAYPRVGRFAAAS